MVEEYSLDLDLDLSSLAFILSSHGGLLLDQDTIIHGGFLIGHYSPFNKISKSNFMTYNNVLDTINSLCYNSFLLLKSPYLVVHLYGHSKTTDT